MIVFFGLISNCKPAFCKKRIVIGITQEPKTLNPLTNSMSTGYELIALLNRGLSVWDDRWEIIPDLAEFIPTLKNKGVIFLKEGKMKVVWKLKKGLKWSNGKDLTASDFVYTHELALNPKMPVLARDFDKHIVTIKAVDDLTLEVVWDSRFPYYDSWYVHPVLPKEEFEKAIEASSSEITNSFGSIPFSSNGPFRLSEWIAGVKFVFERNDKYLRIPAIEEIVYKIIPSSQTLEANLLSNTIDASCDLTLDKALYIKKSYPQRFDVDVKEGLIYEHIDFNLSDPYLKIAKFRQAVVKAIDREKIVKAIVGERALAAHSWLHPRHYGYSDDITKYGYDPKASRKLLWEAGFKFSNSGRLVDSSGRNVKMTIMSTAQDTTRKQIEILIQSYLKEIGIELTIENKQPRIFFSEYLQKRKFPHLALYAIKSNPNTDGVILWTRDNIPSQRNGYKGQNYSGYESDESDELLLKVPKTFGKEKRAELLKAQQKIWASDLPSIPLYYRYDVCVKKKNFKGYEPTGNIIPTSWNAQDWDFTQSRDFH